MAMPTFPAPSVHWTVNKNEGASISKTIVLLVFYPWETVHVTRAVVLEHELVETQNRHISFLNGES